MTDFTDDSVVYRCRCGWTGRWDEAFGHVVSEGVHGDEPHAIIEPPVDTLRPPAGERASDG